VHAFVFYEEMDVFGVFQIDPKIIILLRLSSFPSFSLDNMLP